MYHVILVVFLKIFGVATRILNVYIGKMVVPFGMENPQPSTPLIHLISHEYLLGNISSPLTGSNREFKQRAGALHPKITSIFPDIYTLDFFHECPLKNSGTRRRLDYFPFEFVGTSLGGHSLIFGRV